ncbi:bifunctional 2-polyprenyl-6-hydroxyphenol methylase/3-demethylubiquinol 3-O-methyltransferase UbiG [Methylobacter sp. S3L5C]|uniref:class I SAM-dependent methyltransferase n=1 Tax=Methylobacter sp. S3L5C TaxID=2839024 RepID=UPI001FAD46C3|nr:methyltransferase domain-containing protein [Methylobacter sp. S3L5C]UOA09870.1 methyltransferase domain-containing protein [Methylobacter sp. S3L5C]
MDAVINKSNHLYSQPGQPSYKPTQILTENDFLLPITGTALDLACGLGANAIFLAQNGLAVTAWDISFVAIEKLTTYAAQQGLNINACQEKIVTNSLTECSFDVIVVSRFLDRTLSDAIIGALKPDGLLFYQTFTREKTSQNPPNNPDYLLGCSELLKLFSPLKVVFYRENALIGQQLRGLRNEAQFVGQKRK